MTDTPLVRIDLVNHHVGGAGVLVQYFLEHLRYAAEQALLLFNGDAFVCYFDIHVWHADSLCQMVSNSLRRYHRRRAWYQARPGT